MPDFEKIEGKRKDSVIFVHEGFIYTKNNADSLKTRLRCHRWRDGCKGTAFIQGNHFYLTIKCQHEPEMSEVKKRKVESEIKNIAGTICTPLRMNKYRGVTYSRRWVRREVFQKDRSAGV